METAPIIHLDPRSPASQLVFSLGHGFCPLFLFRNLKKKNQKEKKIEADSPQLTPESVIPSSARLFPCVSLLSVAQPLHSALFFPPFLSPLLSPSPPSLSHTHAHTLLSLFLSAEILYLPPMTYRPGVGEGGRDQRTQPLSLHGFNVLNRHRKSRAHLKNTL